MADITKHAPIGFGGRNLISDFKIHFSLFRTKTTVAIAYGFGFMFVFIAVTIFLPFTLSPPNSSSPCFTSIFAASTSSTSSSSSSPSFFSYLNAHNSSPTEDNVRSLNPTMRQYNFNKEPPVEVLKPTSTSVLHSEYRNTAISNFTSESNKGSSDVKNHTQIADRLEFLKENLTQTDKVEYLKTNQSTIGGTNHSNTKGKKNGDRGFTENGLIKNLTSSDDLINSLMKCNFYDGNWVKDDSYPLYKPGSCSLIDEQFNCFLNGRPDNDYQRMKWKPKACTLPRLNGSHMLEMLIGKRLVFVGDSLNRNMWESLICILRNSVKDQSKVYEQQGRHNFRTKASFSFIFEDYNCTVEFFVTPFLVQEWDVDNKNGTKKETLRLDIIERSADHYKNADIIVFNTGHWWTHEKTSKGEDYYQEGSHVYKELNVLEAFRKALTTWGRWIDANVNPMKTLLFFRGYSASHFSGGQWNSGGQCDHETEPIKNDTYLTPYPPKMTVLENVLKGMKTRVTYLNVTTMTDYRKDGHPSIYRKQNYSEEEKRSPLSFQDCSHWCLPGVPDAWNEILYAELLVNQKQRQKRHQD
ncbi:protein trichome birefringence-like [Olea europaea var. sylvestris]|uniref:protein trichome birefringence-like n=1 Tax=Olea europaea var. sylvestris TaxID=158386 RepID=UPI000C1D3BDF|nr:protein trichome birefringence-like [Olea europaea var. sylvestris]